MALWDAEFETLRPKLREEAAAFIAAIPWREEDTAQHPVEDLVAAHRASQLGGAPSDRAVDRVIDGPGGPVRLRTFVHEQPRGVLFHIHGGAWMAGSPEMMDQLHEIVVDTCGAAVGSAE